MTTRMPMRNMRLTGLLALLLAVAAHVPAAICGKAVVLDFPVGPRDLYVRDECRCLVDAEKPLETESDIRGWWLGSNDIYTNANVGKLAGDAISDALRKNSIFEITSREDLKYYLADKRDLIKAKFPNLDDKQLGMAIMALDPRKIGEELGVEYVVIGKVCTAEMRASRAFQYFNSTMSFSVVVIEVSSGRPVFQASYGGSKGRRSQFSALEEFAVLVAQDVGKLMRTGVHPNPRIQQREP